MTAIVIAIPLIIAFYAAFFFFGVLFAVVRYLVLVFFSCIATLFSFPFVKWCVFGFMLVILYNVVF